MYNSSAYALNSLCPKYPDKCSNKQFFLINRENQQLQHKVKNMIAGESCTFEVEGNCGAPSFAVEVNRNTPDSSTIGISFIEYNSNIYNFFRANKKTLVAGDPGTRINFSPDITFR